ncbi:MAG: c-type cytochrome [Planctomycetia bacterium]|nr:c-type cytochrome [Planctomycetia bacterium]
MVTSRFGILFVLSAVGLAAAPTLKDRLPRLAPREPTDAVKTFRLRDGFTMQPVAVEPQVASPVAAAYDEDGRLYVVEMRDYPEPHKPGEIPLGRVRLVEDKDGDGVYETATVFAEHLPWPTGIACWDGGVYVTAAPDIWYLKDTTGDRKADVKRKAYTGFVVNNVQALVNGLQWGVDNRIYGVTAGNGGSIRPGDKPDAKPIPVSGRDFAFDPRTGAFEAIAGTAQFGNAFDDWYNRFVCANRLVCGHAILPASALARNPHLAATKMVHDCAVEGSSEVLPMFQLSPAEPWRVVRTERYKKDGQMLPESEMVATGIFTSGTGITIYRGAAYPKEYRGQMFVGNVAGNLVHRRRLKPNGATFSAERIDEKSEFLASTDNWFRPVNFVNAPDGTLHVIDMYREVVEHPWSIPEDIKNELHMDSGRDRGRIWRLTPPGFKRPAAPKLGTATTAELVATLENPNSWWRETAQRLLVQRQDKSAVEPLRKLFATSKEPLARLHAMWSLKGLGELKSEEIETALKSDVQGVRRTGLQFIEADSAKVRELTGDPDAQVRFAAALKLGELTKPNAWSAIALVRLALRDSTDPWVRIAILTSSAEQSDAIFAGLASVFSPVADAQPFELMLQLVGVVGTRAREVEIEIVLKELTAANFTEVQRRDLLVSLGDGLLRKGRTLRDVLLIVPHKALFTALIEAAAKTAFDPKATERERTQSMLLLSHAEFTTAKPVFEAVLNPRQPSALQLVAVRAMRSATDPAIAPILLNRWDTLTPAVRGEAITTLSSRPAWAGALLDAVEAGTVARAQIDSPRQTVLKNHRDTTVRDRATKLFASATSKELEAILAKYKPAADKPGDGPKGKEIFRRDCASCHLAGNVGQIVGPAVATFKDKSPAELLTAILDPNREVDPRYLNYTLSLADGRTTSGMIGGESPTAVTLRRAEGASEIVLRTQIDELKSTKQSLMPEGLEKKITVAEMADLIAFLRDPR